jgi:hypothetical protein
VVVLTFSVKWRQTDDALKTNEGSADDAAYAKSIDLLEARRTPAPPVRRDALAA